MIAGQQSGRHYPSQQLNARIAAKTLNEDSAQGFIANKLDQLLDRLGKAPSQAYHFLIEV